jgi:hypothetical protein
MIEFPQDFKEFLKLLNLKKIEYLVIGGYAVGYHGYPRATGDLDIWIAIDQNNATKTAEALYEFGFNLTEADKHILQTEKKVLRMGIPPMRLEILTTIDGVSFAECFNKRIVAEIDDITVNFISKEDLLKNKLASARPQDIADAGKLTKL